MEVQSATLRASFAAREEELSLIIAKAQARDSRIFVERGEVARSRNADVNISSRPPDSRDQ